MLLPPKNEETFALAFAIENGLKAGMLDGTLSEPLSIANFTIENYVNTIIDKIVVNGQFEVKPVSVIHNLSNTQLWVLCYIGVQEVLKQLQGNLNYTIMSAIETFKEENPNINIEMDGYSAIDITNIVFDTEFDIVLFYLGLEIIIGTILENQQNIMFENQQKELLENQQNLNEVK